LYYQIKNAMKTTKITYWILTGILAAFMFMSSIPDVMYHPDAVAIITHLGYPTYFIPFIGVLKILGVIAILIPGFPKVKEWAYAGLVFDLVGAFYSHISVGDPASAWAFPLIALALVVGSYIFHHKRLAEKGRHEDSVSVKS